MITGCSLNMRDSAAGSEFLPLEEAVEIEPQELKPFERKGFTVVECGGTEIST